MQRTLLDVEHEQFRKSVRSFLEQEAVPYVERWDRQGIVDREFFEKAGAVGFIGMGVPEQYGGGGVRDFRYNQVFAEEYQRLGLAGPGSGITLENDICLPYLIDLATEEQRERWLPDICAGRRICAIAMTEPGAGSDLASMA